MRFFFVSMMLGIIVFLPSAFVQADIVPCQGPDCQACNLVELGQNLLTWFIGIMASFIALMFAIGGLKMVMSGGNTESVSKARSIMSSSIIGFFILLAAWLIVDTVMKLFVDEAQVGVWNSIECAVQPTMTGTPGGTPTTGPIVTGGTPPVAGGSGVQCSPSNSACSVNALKALGYTDTQANVMSCIAMTESSGNPNTPPYDQTHPGSNSSACGLFQIVRTTWKANATGACSNFETSCKSAVCNAQVARTLVSRNGYSDWTCPSCNAKAQGCINKYGG